ncbi:MAG: hypothetical protein WBX15_18215 [Thermoanaerobaculia bacterium]
MWAGDVRSERGRWRLDAPEAIDLLEGGHLWDPRATPFEAWETYRDAAGEAHTESLYSMFQCFPLEWKQMWLTSRVDTSIFAGLTEPPPVIERMMSLGNQTVQALQGPSHQDDVAFVCQAVSARYYPLTQTDRRTITLKDRRFDWDWYDFIANWSPIAHAAELSIDAEELEGIHRTLAMLAQSRDPLERWYQLVRFIALDRKEQLKGVAQFAQLLYAMEHMVRLFAMDARALDLYPPDEDRTWTNAEFYGEEVPDDPLKHLEFVVNTYHLNPRPKLILVVEGPGEESAIPRIARDALGHSFPTLGIEMRTLGGVGEYTGSKRHEKRGALEKFIDDYHYRQTVVVVVLDREGRVEQVTKRLLAVRSRLHPKRMLTCPEYIHLWKRNIEFDNFTHAEIASALTTVSDGRYQFTEGEVADTERAYDRRKADPLSALHRSRLGHDLDKVTCLDELAKLLIAAVADTPYADRPKQRPILKLLDDIIDRAALNHQPTTADSWRSNQDSGYFGRAIAVTPDSQALAADDEDESE